MRLVRIFCSLADLGLEVSHADEGPILAPVQPATGGAAGGAVAAGALVGEGGGAAPLMALGCSKGVLTSL